MDIVTNITSGNASTSNINIAAVKCSLQIPLLFWDPSSFNEAAKLSTILAIFVNVITIPLTLFFNALVIIVVWKNASLQVERVVVLAYLALTDFLVGLACQPLFIARNIFHLKHGAPSCEIDSSNFFFGFLLVRMSWFQIAVVTYDRYVAIIHPYEYPTRITVKKLTYATLGLWASNILILVLYFILLAFHVSVWYMEIASHIKATVITTCIIYWYVHIFAVIRRHNRQIVQEQPNVDMNNPDTKKNHKGAITAALLLACYFLTVIPLPFVLILKQSFGFTSQSILLASLRPWVFTFSNLGSLLNPIIYGLRTTELREKCFQLLGLQHEVAAPVQHSSVSQQ